MIKPVFVARICFVPLALTASLPLSAQTASPVSLSAPPASDLRGGDDPASLLSDNLKALARDPYNVDALIQAGQGALAVGDPNAAFGFFARAEELSPSNWRAKAGLGSSLTMMEKSRDALRLFDESAGLGAPEQDLVADRGLAHDLEGDGKKAQRDYLSALKARPSDEVTRRLALSLGISGDKDAALTRLEALLRRNDQGAWRARAFILAMNGDMPGAEKIVRMVVPAEAAGSMTGFLQRLASLNPAARAHAVHFGTLPSSGQAAELATLDENIFRPLDAAAAARLVTPELDRKPPSAMTPAVPRDARRQSREQRDLVRLADRGRRAVEQTAPGRSPSVGGASVAASAGARVVPLPPVSGALASSVAPRPEGAGSATPAPVKGVEMASVDVRPAPLFEVPPSPQRPTANAQVRTPSLTQLSTPMTAVKPAALPQSSAPQMTLAASSVAVSASPPLAPAAAPPLTGSVSPPATMPSGSTATTTAPPTTAGTENRVVYGPQLAAASPTPVAMSEPMSVPASEAMPSSATLADPVGTTATAPGGEPAVSRPALSLSDIVRTLELEPESQPVALPDAAKLRTLQLAAQKKAAAEEKARAERREEERREAEEAAKARRHPARTWVQVATGNNTQGLPGTWRSIKSRTAATLDGQKAWFVPFRQTNRLLVGPVKSASEARALVNSLAKQGLQATIFSSDPGQEIERIGGK